MSVLSPHRSDQLWADLWLFDLQSQGAQLLALGRAGQLFDAGVLARASGFASETHAQAFLASHAGLRLVLINYGCNGREPFELGPNGKPVLAGGLHFNLSRTSQAVMIAVSNAAVGIDIELRRPVTLTEPQIEEVGALLRRINWGPGAPPEPLHTWTAMEAWVKYHGFSMRRFFEDSTLVACLAGDLAAQRVVLTPLVLPPYLCGTLCAGPETSVNYADSRRFTPPTDIRRLPR